MKNKLFFLPIIILISFAIFFLFDYKVSKNLYNKQAAIENKWNSIIIILKERNKYVQLNLSHNNAANIFKYIQTFEKFFKNENTSIYNSEKLKPFIYNEYLLNNEYINLKGKKLLSTEIVNKIDDYNQKLNYEIIIFKEKIRDYNSYRISFLNVFIARKYTYKKIKFFDYIVYGKKNKNPLVKSNAELWIETGDPKYLEN